MDDFLAECDYMNKEQEKRNYITDDEKRAKDSTRAKALIDKYHKHFINETLKNFKKYDKELVHNNNKNTESVSNWKDLLTQFRDAYIGNEKKLLTYRRNSERESQRFSKKRRL